LCAGDNFAVERRLHPRAISDKVRVVDGRVSSGVDAASALGQSLLFKDVPAAVVARVAGACPVRPVAAGERLLSAGEANDTLYVVIRGTLGVHIARPGRPDVLLGPGQCVGELSVIDGSQVSADVIAVKPAEVVAIARERIWALIEASPIAARNMLWILAGRVRKDNAARIEADRVQAETERAATVDVLTGLGNRRWLESAFARQLQRTTAAGLPIAMLMIDVDGFKEVNDEHGHPAGDAVLRLVARWLGAAVRPQDLVARYGGDEFAVLLPDCTLEQATEIGERIRDLVVRQRGDAPAGLPPVSLSIGAALHQHANTIEELMAAADAALYEAKRSGRNRVAAADDPQVHSSADPG
jgi:diguanylate cyclase (GGDEF)-like protein